MIEVSQATDHWPATTTRTDEGLCNQFMGERHFVDNMDDNDLRRGGGNQLVSGDVGDVSEVPLMTHATPETPIGRNLRFHTDKHSTPMFLGS